MYTTYTNSHVHDETYIQSSTLTLPLPSALPLLLPLPPTPTLTLTPTFNLHTKHTKDHVLLIVMYSVHQVYTKKDCNYRNS